ncbi:MAG: hypothetical protein LBC74_13690, partial [Planctomycetaceae bacterium]|nr:hypothetical protein [Planctomycetaceae bacterium]
LQTDNFEKQYFFILFTINNFSNNNSHNRPHNIPQTKFKSNKSKLKKITNPNNIYAAGVVI